MLRRHPVLRSSAPVSATLTRTTRTFATKSALRARIPPFVYQQLAQNARGPNPFWKQPIVRYGTGAVAVGGSVYYVSHLETVEMTHRRRLMTITPEQEAMVSKETYEAVLQQYGDKILPDSDSRTRFVKKVVGPLVRASGMTDLNWEVHVIESAEPNAFVIPGGKIFVFSGILPIAKNESGLASVLGHEIGHQVARHISEKMSFNPLIQAAQFAIAAALASFGLPTNIVYGLSGSLTSLVLDNPYSRVHESEADHIGLLLMAQACFDPQESVHMWERMSQAGNSGIPQFMSTHPSNENRIVKLQGWMPEAIQKQESSDCQQSLGGLIGEFRDKQKHASW
ncbi:Mitochondrial metalloendopeptidase OMA1 [Taphrina deformans PYCC 5710]|uniref:Mitochondrial metalloendopeptidase OMA1 n=1 Tax=Taphrina deformans (strain PYCC 5710 / ATCC 11124 / CBS 356.35 / IMI 108563 / JCM 9778 / NBRC 8474) TaxID=1097556 RepID=R4XIK5_TAPDE|nr:Mitochondrial metalloendopeptidase OMA1 [Taphrina deformans PYCC 5710]|eukprot:CCG83192.1 Mitochondrial metalloendopeptidase OMA1 [Taphrina deformans PYCC 5710]